MDDVNREGEIRIRVVVQSTDGGFCALDSAGNLLAEADDFIDLRDRLDREICARHGARARAVLLVGRALPDPEPASVPARAGSTADGARAR
jgi:hypothetical protein